MVTETEGKLWPHGFGSRAGRILQLKAAKAALFAAGTACFLSGCTLLLTDYQRPSLPQITSFAHAQQYLGAQIGERYWQLFADGRLDALIEQSLQVSYDLNDAYLNVRAAQAQLGLTRTNLHPSISAGADVSLDKELEHGGHNESAGTSLNLSYEADLFGRLAAARREAAESFKASAYDYWAMRLAVVASSGAAYWQYAYASEAVRLGEEELTASARRLQLVQAQYRAGAADGLDYDSARVDHLVVQDSLQQRRQALFVAQNAINLLLEQPPQQQVNVSPLDTAVLPEVALTLPAALLSRRPDLMAAEARLRAALAGSDEARLNFYPQFNLTAGLTAGDGAAIARFISDPLGSLGAAVTFPFLNYNELSYAEEAALVEKDRAQLDFVHTYLTALQECADAIDAVNYYRQAVDTMTERENLARRNYQRYEARYRAGACALNDLLDASDTLRTASLSLLQVKRDVLIAILDLMTAMGGDFSEDKLEAVVQKVTS